MNTDWALGRSYKKCKTYIISALDPGNRCGDNNWIQVKSLDLAPNVKFWERPFIVKSAD